MLQLVSLAPAFGMRNVSPFCLKSEMLLTALELPFELSEQADPRKAPKGKLPYLVADRQTVADSELIALFLDELTGGRVYGGLAPAEMAAGVALTRLAEDHLYWMMVASRWLDDDWWPNVVREVFDFVPGVVRPLAAAMARRQIRKTYDLQGLGRHSLEEQQGFARRDLEALEAAVPGEDFLFGAAPGIFDFTVAAMMAGVFDNQPATWLTDLAAPCGKLKDYTERVQESVGVWGRR